MATFGCVVLSDAEIVEHTRRSRRMAIGETVAVTLEVGADVPPPQ